MTQSELHRLYGLQRDQMRNILNAHGQRDHEPLANWEVRQRLEYLINKGTIPVSAILE